MLALDLGNSALKAALFDADGRIAAATRFAWEPGWEHAFSRWTASHPVGSAALASVVPQHTRAAERVLVALGWPRPFRLDAHQRLPVRIAYATPGTLGADRIAAAVAAFALYGSTGPVVALDAGTALTYEVVDATGTYLGGAIAPGGDLLVESLAQSTAQLPRVSLELPPSPIANTTRSAIQSGIVYGLLDGIGGMLTRIERVLGTSPFVVATGGQATWIAQHEPRISVVRPHLVLEGIRAAALWQER